MVLFKWPFPGFRYFLILGFEHICLKGKKRVHFPSIVFFSHSKKQRRCHSLEQHQLHSLQSVLLKADSHKVAGFSTLCNLKEL